MADRTETYEVLKGVYDHYRWLSDQQSTGYRTYIDKIHKLMTIQIVLFAALSYGLGSLDWLKKQPLWLTTIMGLLGVMSAIFIGLGFYYGIKLLMIGEKHVVGTQRLNDVVKAGTIAKLHPDDLWGDLSQNLNDALTRDRERQNADKQPASRLNFFTVLGYCLVATFVVVSAFGDIASKIGLISGK